MLKHQISGYYVYGTVNRIMIINGVKHYGNNDTACWFQ